MHDVYTGALIALAIAVYVTWRKYSSLKAKEELAKHLNNVLSDKKSGLTEKEKLALVEAWEHCSSYKFYFAVLKILTTRPSKNSVNRTKSSTMKEGRKTAILLLLKVVWVNAKLMPLSYLVLSIVLFAIVVIFSKMSLWTTRMKAALDSYVRHVHI